MSADGAGSREVAYRLFAAEFDDADFSYSESDEERAPNYVVTPTGARVNRLFVVGVLTEVEQVSDDVLRARVVDPTGAFVVYAGQYQPEAMASIERTEPPAFVAVTGKARTFQPEDSERVFTSVRPESVSEVDAATRDRWTVQAAEQTVERVAVAARALESDLRGEALRDALVGADVDPGLADGVVQALDHYGTTAGYLAAVRTLALDAARVVAGEREEVRPLEVAPDEGGEADLASLAAGAPELLEAAAEATGEPATAETGAEPGAEATEATGATAETATGGETAAEGETGEPETAEPETAEPETAEPEAAEPEAADTEAAEPETAEEAEAEELEDFEGGEFDLDDEERERIEDEYGTEFESGAEVDEPGAADIETPEPETAEAAVEPEGEEDEPETEDTGDTEAGGEGDLEEAVMAAMHDLDAGDGADREALVAAVVEDRGVAAEEVEDAIQEALMDGRCYEPDDETLKPI